MLLGFVVSKRGIEANPEKISAIMDMGPIKNLKGVQRVTDSLHSTTRRVQPATVQADEEVRPLHVDARSTRGTRLTQEPPQESSDIDCSNHGRANALVHIGDDPGCQCGFGGGAGRTREVPKGTTTSVLCQRGTLRLQDVLLADTKTHVCDLDDQAQVRHYFDAHPITVVSKYPLEEVIQNPEAEGRIAKWALKLMGQNITYALRSAIKSQVLTDFVAEWTEMQTPTAKIEHETWIMYFDGSVVKEGAGVGLVFISPLGVRMEYMV
jgi:hypothetical protein